VYYGKEARKTSKERREEKEIISSNNSEASRLNP
jgi:hypothetical protein